MELFSLRPFPMEAPGFLYSFREHSFKNDIIVQAIEAY